MLEEFCKQLKEKREESGYSIEDVVEKTKLYPVAIRDIEDGNLENISPIYLKGFIKIYASFLGIDATQALKDVSSVKPKPKPSFFKKLKNDNLPKKDTVAPPVSEKKNAIGESVVIEKPVAPQKNQADFPAVETKKLTVLLILAVILMIGAVSFSRFIIKAKDSRRRKQIVAEQAAGDEPGALKKVTAKEAKKNARDKIKKPLPKNGALKRHKKEIKNEVMSPRINLGKDFSQTAEMTVSLTAKKNCFIKVKSDGKLLFEGILKKGVVESWRGQKVIDLKTSDGSALYIELNGRPLPVLTAMHKPIKSLKITPAGISVDK